LTSFGGAVGRGGLFGLDRTLFHSSSSDGRGGLHPYLKDQRQQKEEQKVKMQMTNRIGTVPYMAPELFLNEEYNTSVDVYSYSMVLWELLHGKRV